VGRADAINAMPASSRSAELPYEPGELVLARCEITGATLRSVRTVVGRALRYAGAPRPPAARNLTAVTFLNGRKSDISIWWTH
jgi:hypothetical protein